MQKIFTRNNPNIIETFKINNYTSIKNGLCNQYNLTNSLVTNYINNNTTDFSPYFSNGIGLNTCTCSDKTVPTPFNCIIVNDVAQSQSLKTGDNVYTGYACVKN